MGFVLDKMILGQVSSYYFGFLSNPYSTGYTIFINRPIIDEL
jgi:hypothetical protein